MTVFADVDTGMLNALTSAGLSAYAYESPALSKVPCTTFVLDSFGPDWQGVDQAFGFGVLTYKLRHYVALDTKDARVAWDQLKTGIDTIRDALGTDRTLGGQIRDLDVVAGRCAPVQTVATNRRELMAELRVETRVNPLIG